MTIEVKISALPLASTFNGTEQVSGIQEQSGNNKNVRIPIGTAAQRESDQNTRTTDSVQYDTLTITNAVNVPDASLTLAKISNAGTIASQDSDNATITGGTINNTVIGGVTPAAGTFTTLISNSIELTPEEGEWTPVLEGNSTAGNNSYLEQVGQYTLIGRLCQIRFEVQLDGTSGALDSVGNLRIAGIPFTGQLNGFDFLTSGSGWIEFPNGISLTAGDITYGRCGSTNISLRVQSNTGSAPLTNTDCADNLYLIGSLTYEVA